MRDEINASALVLAAHGSATDSTVHEFVEGYVDRLRRLSQFTEVSAAFHLGEPHFSTVLDQFCASCITVVPLMTSRGFFSDIVLPKALSRNRRWKELDIAITDPVGTHHDMTALVFRRVSDCINRNDFDTNETSVILVGHGTPRHAQSSASTMHLVDGLRMKHPAWDISAGFLDGVPTVETALADAEHANVVVEPFLIADGPHASQDIPRRLGMEAISGQSLPISHRVGNRTVACDSAVGTDPAILDLITDLAVRSVDCKRQRTRSGLLVEQSD